MQAGPGRKSQEGLRFIDNAHTSAAESFDDEVAGNPGSNHERYRARASVPRYAHGTERLKEGQRRSAAPRTQQRGHDTYPPRIAAMGILSPYLQACLPQRTDR
jgi:hypothetical protein